MKLIVGLGNPGKEYENTRHNVGFSFIDYLLNNKGITEAWQKKFDGLYLQTTLHGEKVFFLKPQTFMNLSGNSVRKIMDYYHIPVEDILVVSDDMDLLVGNFKLRSRGSSGGHNGLKNIEDNLHTSNYKRLKIGISKDKDQDMKDYVLGSLSKEDQNTLLNLYKDLCDVIDDYFKLNFGDLMSKYNRKNR